MKIFLTGGTGFIGKNFINLALKNGHHIFAITRKKKQSKIDKLTWLFGEIDDDWSKYLKNIDVVVHLAAKGVIYDKKEDSKSIFKFNIDKSLNMIFKLIKNNCINFVIASTSSEYFNDGECKKSVLKISSKRGSSSSYSASKIIFTNILKIISKKSKCNFRIMRIFPTYGEGEYANRLYPTIKKKAQEGKNLFIKNPNEIRDFTNVKYVSKVLLDACKFKKKKNFDIFHISSNNKMSIKEFAFKQWKKYKAKGKLTFDKGTNKFTRHVSDKNSVWKIQN